MAFASLPLVLKLLAAKEVADFMQIGLVSWQTGKRFSGSRSGPGGSVGIDGGTVRIQVDGASMVLPIDDAARLAGVSGVAGKGRVGDLVEAARGVPGLGSSRAVQASIAAGGLEPRVVPHRVREVLDRPAEAYAPDPDNAPFTAREFVLVQEHGKDVRQGVAIAGERALELLRQTFNERIAGARDELTRARLQQDLVEQERELRSRAALQRERLDAEEARAEQRFRHQVALDDRERAFKSVEAVADRAWRERTQREMVDTSLYQKNLAADLAVDRATRAAKQIASVLTSLSMRGIGGGVKPETVERFAGRFSTGVS